MISRAAYLHDGALTTTHRHAGAHTTELAVSTCEAARSFRWSVMVTRYVLATTLVSAAESALLSQRLTHASQKHAEMVGTCWRG